MKTRGRILRDTNAGPGLLAVNGQQLPFTLEGHWKSPVATAANMPVDVELDTSGAVLAVHAVDPAQVAREQAEQALQMARERGGQALAVGGQLLGGLSGAVGMSRLVLTGLLFIGWYVLATLKVKVFGSVVNVFTLWDLIPALNSAGGFLAGMQNGSGGSRGLYGLLMIAATFAPLLPGVWKNPKAQLGAVAPLAWLLLVLIFSQASLQSGMSEVSRAGGADMGDFAKEMMREVMKAISFGLGLYLSFAVSALLAFSGYSGWRAAKNAAHHSL